MGKGRGPGKARGTPARARSGALRNAARTRAALVEAAALVISQHGFEKATLAVIGRAAGVNPALVGYHFGSKKALYREAVGRPLDELLELVKPLAESQEPAGKRVAEFVSRFAIVTGKHPVLARHALRESVAGGTLVGKDVRERMSRVFRVLDGIVRAGMASGEFAEVLPLAVHMSIVGALTFYFGSADIIDRALDEGALSRPQVPTPAQFVAHLQKVTLAGLKKK